MKKQEEEFKEKELCWAKMKGYPWWPAMINQIIYKNQRFSYEVIYLGDKEKSFLSHNYIKKWKDNYNKYKICFDSKHKIEKKTKTSFECALKIGDLLYEGKINIDDHINFMEHFQIIKRKRNKESIIKYFNELLNNKKINNISGYDIDKNEINKDKEINFINKKLSELNKIKINSDRNLLYEEEKNTIKDNSTTSFKKKFKKSKSLKKFLEKKRKNENILSDNSCNISINIPKDHEISMNQNELNKMKNLVNIITSNLDKILEKSNKYQSYLKNEFSKINFDYKDNKQINFKIGLISYVKTMSELLNVPILLNKYIDDINSK